MDGMDNSLEEKIVEAIIEEIKGSSNWPTRNFLNRVEEQISSDDTPRKVVVGAKSSAVPKALIITTGINKTGIVAGITAAMASMNVDIMDISQTIIGEFFTMIVVANLTTLSENSLNFKRFKENIKQVSGQIGVETVVMHEDILRTMHRV